jgi:23S rRNA-/tRNA-specific pseudouridylate synthase
MRRYWKTRPENQSAISAPWTVHRAGRPSQTGYLVRERFPSAAKQTGAGYALLELSPKQGRMHQIRVHLAHAGFPLAVDSLYGRRKVLTARDLNQSGDTEILTRMPLHAARLTFPFRGKTQTLEAPLPEDMSKAIELLRTLKRSDS